MLKTLLMAGGEGVAEHEWETKLLASDAAANSLFGYSVSISVDGTRIIIGAYGNASNRGAAYVFVRDGSTWTQEVKLLASDRAASDRFGYSVSISGDGTRVIAGAYYKNSGAGNGQGAAYIFIRSGSTWTEEQKLLAMDATAFDNFGWSVSISSDGYRVIIGADRKNSGTGVYQGAAYIFVRSGTTWTEEEKLLASDPVSNDNFGYSVSISSDGTRAIVGAYRKSSGGGGGQGAAYVFVRTGAAWAEEAKLLASDPVSNDNFGYSVSISSDGTRAIVGAYRKSSGGGGGQGAAYVFVRTGAAWAEEAKLLASDPVSNDNFGYSVSISSDGTRAIVGAYRKSSGGGGGQGAAYVFARSDTVWIEEQKLLASDPEEEDQFGNSVTISSDGARIIIGASRKNSRFPQQGAVYIFSRSGTTWTQEAKLLASDPAENDYFGYSVSISGDGSIASVGTRNKNSGAGTNQGATYIYDLALAPQP